MSLTHSKFLLLYRPDHHANCVFSDDALDRHTSLSMCKNLDVQTDLVRLVRLHAFRSCCQDHRFLCDALPDVVFSAWEIGIKVNLVTPRCICEENVSRD